MFRICINTKTQRRHRGHEVKAKLFGEYLCEIIRFYNSFMRNALLILSVAIFFSACQPAATTSNSPTAKRYPFVGKVVSVNKAAKKATISHEDIPGYMGAMTMEFPIHEDWVWNDLTPGSEVHADLVVDNTAKDPFWLEKVGIVAAADPNQTPTPDPTIGKQIPDFTLTNQDGKKISPKDFRGKAWAITFIYARCPLPDYCIRMSTNFSDLANSLKDNAELKDKDPAVEHFVRPRKRHTSKAPPVRSRLSGQSVRLPISPFGS